MMTEEKAIASARTQYRAAFRAMTCGGAWSLFATQSGVTLDRAGTHLVVLVADVQAMALTLTICEGITMMTSYEAADLALDALLHALNSNALAIKDADKLAGFLQAMQVVLVFKQTLKEAGNGKRSEE